MTNEEMLQNKEVYRDEILKSNLNLVYKLAHQFLKYRIWDNEFLDDLIGEGYIGLCKAVDLFDPSKGVKFSTFASTCIINCFWTYVRNTNEIRFESRYVNRALALCSADESELTARQKSSLKHYRRISGGPVDLISDVENGFENLEGENEEYFDEEEFREKIQGFEKELDKYIANNFHKTNREIACTFDVTKQTISNHRKKIIEDLRKNV